MSDDAQLLRDFATTGANEPFAALVRRHLDFVYAAALRQVRGNAALAEDVTQMVFSDLARKATELARHPALIGWLHTATRYAAGRAMRSESRRLVREREAQAIDEATREIGATADWARLQPVIDETLGTLKERERTAVLLRFFQGKSLAEVGAALSLTESAARSCVDRALEKMHAPLARRGITSTSAALGLALANQISVAAPMGLAATVVGSAVAGTAGGGAFLFGTLLTMSKIKIGLASAIVLAGLATTFVELQAHRELRSDVRNLGSSYADPAALARENQRLNAAVKKAGDENPDLAELARLRTRIAAYQNRPPGVVESEMKPLRNAGRATPEAAFESFCWAVDTGDLDALASFVVFHDDTPENRAAFLAQFSEAIRARYRTPERILVVGVGFTSGVPTRDPAVAAQILGVEEERPGRMTVKMWVRQASGREAQFKDRLQKTPHGWALEAVGLTDPKLIPVLQARIDPVTGEPRPMKP